MKRWARIRAARSSDQELLDIENTACPGAGACGGQFTANTMATVMEMIGLAPMNTAAVPQVDKRKEAVAVRCGKIAVEAVQADRRPRSIATRDAFENAIASVAATGGSTNAVLHLLAMAHEAGIELADDDFQTHQRAHAAAGGPEARQAGSSRSTWTKPAACPVIAKRLADGGYVDTVRMTITGRTFGEEAAEAKETPGQEVIRPLVESDQGARRAGDSAKATWLPKAA